MARDRTVVNGGRRVWVERFAETATPRDGWILQRRGDGRAEQTDEKVAACRRTLGNVLRVARVKRADGTIQDERTYEKGPSPPNG